MSTGKIRGLVAVALGLAAVMATAGGIARVGVSNPASTARGAPPGVPAVMVWAWERPEFLEFLDPREVGVAFLAQTVHLASEAVRIQPRLNPLRVPSGARLVAVSRVTTDDTRRPTFSPEQVATTVEALQATASLPRVSALQVDFDARASERPFYRAVLKQLRRRLPPNIDLSVTALASWCLRDAWVADLPVSEAVPMLFRMGPGGSSLKRALEQGEDFRVPLCRHSLGVSTDEPRPRLRTERQVYLFHPRPWSAAAARDILEEVREWRKNGVSPHSSG